MADITLSCPSDRWRAPGFEGRPGGAEDLRHLQAIGRMAPPYGVGKLSMGLTTWRSSSVATCV